MQQLGNKQLKKLLSSSKKGILRIIFGRTTVILVSLVLQFLLLFHLMFSLGQHIPALFGGVVTFTAVMLLVVLGSRDDPCVKLSWCILIGVLPVFGAILYTFIRLDLGYKAQKRFLCRSIQESEAFRVEDEHLLPALKEEDRAVYNLAHYLHSNGGHSLCTGCQVQYFPLGEDMFRQMLRELEQAKSFIFLEYFIITPGSMWSEILEILIRKAAQGVEVRVLYDGSCAVTELPYAYPKQLEKAGIRCKMFSPFRPVISTHYNNRDHRKILVVDGHTAFTGGINISDRYINREQVCGHWKDTAVLVRGSAARELTRFFLQMWNMDEKSRDCAPYLSGPSPIYDEPGLVIPYTCGPDRTELVGRAVYLDLINRARERVRIMTPYLILDQETLNTLCFAARRGVEVDLLVPHISDNRYAAILARSHYRDLLEAGIRLYEYTPGFVHAKVFLSDHREAVVGTVNLDYRSLYLHFECAAYMKDVPAIRDIDEDFDRTLAISQRIQAPFRRSAGERLLAAVLKVVAPLM